MDNIGQRLKEIIEAKGLTAIEFSEQVGIQRSSLSHLFSGRNKPSIDLLMKIKRQFPDTDLEWLISGESRKNKSENAAIRNESAFRNENIPVTNVNNTELITDNQNISPIDEENTSKNVKNRKSIKVIIFYDDGSFGEFNK